MKAMLALSAFTAASGDVAFRWPESSATTLAAILFGPLVFAIVWLIVRGAEATDRKDASESILSPSAARFDPSEKAVDC